MIPQHQAKKPRTYPYDAPFCPGSMEVSHDVQWSLVIFTVVYVHDICINKFIIYLAFFLICVIHDLHRFVSVSNITFVVAVLGQR